MAKAWCSKCLPEMATVPPPRRPSSFISFFSILLSSLLLLFVLAALHQGQHHQPHPQLPRRKLLRCPELLGLCRKAAQAMRRKEEHESARQEKERETILRERERLAVERQRQRAAKEAAAEEERRQREVRAAAEAEYKLRDDRRRFRQKMRRSRRQDLDGLHQSVAAAQQGSDWDLAVSMRSLNEGARTAAEERRAATAERREREREEQRRRRDAPMPDILTWGTGERDDGRRWKRAQTAPMEAVSLQPVEATAPGTQLRHPKWRGASTTDRLLGMRGAGGGGGGGFRRGGGRMGGGRRNAPKTDAQREFLRAHLREISPAGSSKG